MSDPMPTIKDILGWPQEPADPIGELIERAENANSPEDAIAWAQMATARAIQALVEQQRIGNIIAWERVTGEENRALIREGLGLQ